MGYPGTFATYRAVFDKMPRVRRRRGRRRAGWSST